jgi:hypothetical protein
MRNQLKNAATTFLAIGAIIVGGAAFVGATAQNNDHGNDKPVNQCHAPEGDYVYQGLVNKDGKPSDGKWCNDHKPTYVCNSVSVTSIGTRVITATANTAVTNGAVFNKATFDFGDGTAPVTVSSASQGHTYAADGTYNVSVSVDFLAYGHVKTVKCATTVVVVTEQVTNVTNTVNNTTETVSPPIIVNPSKVVPTK